MVVYSTSPQTVDFPLRPVSPFAPEDTSTANNPYSLYRYIEQFTEIQPIAQNKKNDNNKTRCQDEQRPVPAQAPSRTATEKFRVRGPLESEAGIMAALAFCMARGLAFIPSKHSGYELIEASARATLDFSLRLFTPKVDLTSWHVTEQKTIMAGNARAFSEGRVWSKDGVLIAIMTQQTILRPGVDFVPRL